MKIRLLLFAAARDRADTNELELEFEDGATVATLKDSLRERWPDLEPLISRSAFAINETYATNETNLSDADQVGWVPPVSGG